jgi:hypothetical protein
MGLRRFFDMRNAYFFAAGKPRFCWGFWRKRGADRGFLMVNLWWKRGELWLVDGDCLRAENFPRITDLFWGVLVLGTSLLESELIGPERCAGRGAWGLVVQGSVPGSRV